MNHEYKKIEDVIYPYCVHCRGYAAFLPNGGVGECDGIEVKQDGKGNR